MKKIISLLLVSIMILSCMTMSVMALSSDNAAAYYSVIENILLRDAVYYNSSSHLIDFDGDGIEELLILYGDFYDYDEMNYEVYSGEKLIAKDKFDVPITYPALWTNDKTNNIYLAAEAAYGDLGATIFYTIENGSWVLKDNLSVAWIGAMECICHINGVEVSKTEYDNAISKYNEYKDLGEKESAEREILSAIDLSVSGYTNIYSKLSANEKKALFDDFLYDIAFSTNEFDSRTATDGEIVSLLVNAKMDTDIPINTRVFSVDEFSELTKQYFGRTIDYTRYQAEYKPSEEDYYTQSLYYDNMFYLEFPQIGGNTGFEPDMGKEPQLYDLGKGTYYATFKFISSFSNPYYDGVFGAIVKKNSDNTYRLVSLGKPMSQAQLDALVNPSDWAVAELNDAEKAGLVPELADEPFMTENATRLQFAQLAVSLAETITGKQLPQNKSVAFKDCNDAAVLKAYQAGIVNGVSDTEFAPNESLTREQLATMIWRTVKYIQKETNKEKLTDGGDISGFADAGDVSDYASEAVAALAKYDIMKGTSETELSPKSACTVEQSVLLIYRTFNKIK